MQSAAAISRFDSAVEIAMRKQGKTRLKALKEQKTAPDGVQWRGWNDWMGCVDLHPSATLTLTLPAGIAASGIGLVMP